MFRGFASECSRRCGLWSVSRGGLQEVQLCVGVVTLSPSAGSGRRSLLLRQSERARPARREHPLLRRPPRRCACSRGSSLDSQRRNDPCRTLLKPKRPVLRLPGGSGARRPCVGLLVRRGGGGIYISQQIVQTHGG